jgi:hypothetical protein
VQLPVAQQGIEHLCADELAVNGPSEDSRQINNTAADMLRGGKTFRRSCRIEEIMKRKTELMSAILAQPLARGNSCRLAACRINAK